MKRDFLKNFKVGDQPLTDEIVDAIMAENGRDIEAAKKPFADYDTIKNQLAEAQKTIKGFQDQGADIEAVRKSAKDWEDKYNKAIADHNQKMADNHFAQRMPVVEEQIKVINHRIDDLEDIQKHTKL